MTTKDIGCFNTESNLFIGKDDDIFIPDHNTWETTNRLAETKECIVRPDIKYN